MDIDLANLIAYIFEAHASHATKTSRSYRKWDGKTPYAIHPTWCGMTILTETTLPEEVRVTGAQALLLHDVLEDTTAGLPAGTSPRVKEVVEKMTFASSDAEMEAIWSCEPEIRLLKLYDKVSNLLDGAWMSDDKRRLYVDYVRRLCDNVASQYGELNIVRIARAITSCS